jgi:hypothetical protein
MRKNGWIAIAPGAGASARLLSYRTYGGDRSGAGGDFAAGLANLKTLVENK